MSNQYIDALVYSGIKNMIKPGKWEMATPKFGQIDNLLDKTTIKRACCLNSGKSGMQDAKVYEVDVRIPLPKGVQGEKTGTKYGYYDKTIKIPKEICEMDEFKDFDYAGEGGNTKCDQFYRAYCENILDDFRKLTGADKDPKKFDMQEFGNFKPECACFVPPLEGLTKEQKMIPQCWFDKCGLSPYRPSNMRTECKLNIQQCIQNVTNQIGNVESSDLQIEKANLVNNCSQDTSSAGGTAPAGKEVEKKETTEIGGKKTDSVAVDKIKEKQKETETEKPKQAASTQQAASPQQVESSQTTAKSNTNMYIGIGVVVFIIIIFLFFMMRRR